MKSKVSKTKGSVKSVKSKGVKGKSTMKSKSKPKAGVSKEKSLAPTGATGGEMDSSIERPYYQQGDVLLKPIAALPDGLELYTAEGGKVLQHGEFTGHMHRFTEDSRVQLFVRPEAERTTLNNGLTIVPGIDKFLIVQETSLLKHEEHAPISVPPGIYSMDLVREYDYDKDEVARVAD